MSVATKLIDISLAFLLCTVSAASVKPNVEEREKYELKKDGNVAHQPAGTFQWTLAWLMNESWLYSRFDPVGKASTQNNSHCSEHHDGRAHGPVAASTLTGASTIPEVQFHMAMTIPQQ